MSAGKTGIRYRRAHARLKNVRQAAMQAAVLGGTALFRGPEGYDQGLQLVGEAVVTRGEVVQGLHAAHEGITHVWQGPHVAHAMLDRGAHRSTPFSWHHA